MELIRPLGHALRQQFLLSICWDSVHIRAKKDKVKLKVFLSLCWLSTFGWMLTALIQEALCVSAWSRLSLKCKRSHITKWMIYCMLSAYSVSHIVWHKCPSIRIVLIKMIILYCTVIKMSPPANKIKFPGSFWSSVIEHHHYYSNIPDLGDTLLVVDAGILSTSRTQRDVISLKIFLSPHWLF